MTWDYYDNYLVLFGGSTQAYNYNVYSAETWTYQNGVWTQLFPLTSPEGRDSTGIAYSPWDAAVALFGGFTPGTGGYLNDTWLFKAGSWTQLAIPGPSPRNGFGFVYDPQVDADVLFGGQSAACPQSVCNDTWEFHFDTWTRVSTTKAPGQRWQLSLAYDANDSDVIMFGGLGVTGECASNGPCGDTWQFNGSAGWVQVPTNVTCGTAAQGPCPATRAPSPRNEASMAYDYTNGYILLFGGSNTSNTMLGDTWTYSNGNWTKLAPTASPSGRNGEALAYDFSSGDGYLLMVGGTQPAFTSPDAIFSWTAGTWNRIAPPTSMNPGPTEGGSMAYDAADGYVVFFGGYTYVPSFSISGATWTYEHGVWTRLPITGPPAAYYGAMAYDPAEGYVMLFPGANGGNSTWGFHAGGWTDLCASICAFGSRPPSDRFGASLAFDPGSSYMILFGGSAYLGGSAGYQYVSQTWAWIPESPTTGVWDNFTSYLGTTVPAPRAMAGMVYDQRDNELVLFGGGNGSSVFGDTWTMNDVYAGWHELAACGGPSQPSCGSAGPEKSAAMIFAYDSVTQAIVMSGGTYGSAFGGGLNWQTYFFQGGVWTPCNSPTCDAYYYGWGTFNGWGAGAFDGADGYTVTEGGLGWYYNYYLGYGTYYQIPYSWVFGTPLFSEGPGFSPEFVEVGQSVTFSVGATGGGVGAYSYSWAGLPTGCAPSSPSIDSFTCVIADNGFTQYAGFNETPNSYFDPSVQVIDSSGSPSTASPQSNSWLGWLEVAPDLTVVLGSSATVADVGQTVYFGLNNSFGWGPYSYSWSNPPPGCVDLRTGYGSERATCLLTSADIGTWYTRVETVDSTGYAAYSQTIALTVLPTPSTTPVRSNVATLDAGQTLTVWVTPAGGDGTYSYSWTGVPAACLSNTPVLSCSVPATEVGTYGPRVTITDGLGSSVVASYTGSILVSPDPTATGLGLVSNLTGLPTEAADAGQHVTFTLNSTPGSGPAQVVWAGLPAGCSPASSDTTIVSCSPTGVGTFSVTATVTDTNGESATSPAATLVVSPKLSAGQLSASGHALDIGGSVDLAVTFSGGSGGTSFAWSALPSGCVSSDSAALSCSPSGAGRSTASVVVTDANQGNLTVTLGSAIVVSLAPTATALSVVDGGGVAIGTVTTGTSVTFRLTSTVGSGGDTVIWSGLPGGCVPSTSNSTSVTCEPNSSGSYSVTAHVTDSNGVSATSPPASLVVTAPPAVTPFATPEQETELGLLAVAIALGAAALVLALRRPRSSSPPPPMKPAPAVSPPPAAAAAGTSTASPSGDPAGTPFWKET